MIRSALAAAVLLAGIAPGLAQAETYLVSDTTGCEAADPVSDSYLTELMGDDRTVLHASGMFAIEWTCEFAEPIDLQWEDGELQTRAGFCMEPGPYIYPTVFVVGLFAGEPDRAYVWEQGAEPAGEATQFFLCPEAK